MSLEPGLGGVEPFPSEVPPLTCTLARKVGVAPVGVAIVQNSCMVLLVAELRASCQHTATFPERRLLATLGKNWLLVVASSLTLIGALHAAPLLSEVRTI